MWGSSRTGLLSLQNFVEVSELITSTEQMALASMYYLRQAEGLIWSIIIVPTMRIRIMVEEVTRWTLSSIRADHFTF